MHMRETFDVTHHILDLHGPCTFLHKDHLSCLYRLSFPPNIILLFSVAYFHPSFFFAASSLSSARLSFALCDPIFLLAPLSFSLPGLPRRHHPPLSRPILPHPPAFAVRDTSSRMSKGDEMRRLVSMETNQLASPG